MQCELTRLPRTAKARGLPPTSPVSLLMFTPVDAIHTPKAQLHGAICLFAGALAEHIGGPVQ